MPDLKRIANEAFDLPPDYWKATEPTRCQMPDDVCADCGYRCYEGDTAIPKTNRCSEWLRRHEIALIWSLIALTLIAVAVEHSL